MFRDVIFSVIIGILLSANIFSQSTNVGSQSENGKSIEILFATTVEDFTRGFIDGFNDSTENQIAAFETQTNGRRDLSKSEKVVINSKFRKSFSAIMERVRIRILNELKIAEGFKAKLVEYYRVNYSEEELIKLTEFMQTPLGKKVLQNQTKYVQLINDFSKSITIDERFLKIINEETVKKDSAEKGSL